MTLDPGGMETRKRRHIDVCLSEAVDFQTVTTGLERYRLPYNALTQTDLGSIELATDFLGARLRAPVLDRSDDRWRRSCPAPSIAIWPPRPSSSASA